MNDLAFEVLHAIAHGEGDDFAEGQAWVAAFETIRWATRDGNGRLSLTCDGLDAYRDIARPRSRERRPSRTKRDSG